MPTYELPFRLLSFLSGSVSRHSIHSPYLYRLVDEVIRPVSLLKEAEPIEKLRAEMKRDNTVIHKTDFGMTALSAEKPAVYPVTVSAVARRSLTPPRHCARLFRLAQFTGANNILELGTSLGITAAYMSCARPSGRIITLEGCPSLSRQAERNLRGLGIGNVKLVTGRIGQTLEGALQELGSVDLVYIDGDHRREAVIENFRKCLDFAHNGTVLVIDDIRHSREMAMAWQEICRSEKVTVSLDLFMSGWVFLRRESSREHFRLRYV